MRSEAISKLRYFHTLGYRGSTLCLNSTAYNKPGGALLPMNTSWHQWVYRKLRFCSSKCMWSGWCKRKRAGSHCDVLKNCCLHWPLLKCSGALNKHLIRTTALQKLINHLCFSYRRNRTICLSELEYVAFVWNPDQTLCKSLLKRKNICLKKSVLERDRFPPVLAFMSCNFNTVENKAMTALFADILIYLIRLIM